MKNNYQACPVCTNWKRCPEHPLCPRCNLTFFNISIQTVIRGEKCTNRLEYALSEGEKTLGELEVELENARLEEKNAQQPYWDQAHQIVQESQRGRIERGIYCAAVGKKFEELWSKNPSGKISWQVRDLLARIRSITALANSLRKKLAEKQG